MPEDLRGNATLSKYSDLNTLAKAHIELQGFVGKKGVFPPGEKHTPEQWKEFAKSIGQPEFDKFEIKTPEGKTVNAKVVEGYKKLAHDAGLMPHQAQGLLDWYIGQEGAQIEERKVAALTEQKTQHENLRKEWGQGYDKEIAKAKLAVKELGGEEFQKYLDSSGLSADATLVRFLAKAGGLMGEDKLRGEGGGGNFGQTPAEIQSDINRVLGDKKGPYWDRSHPGHKQAIAEQEARYKRLQNPG